jgi:hypothetical protein
MFNGAVFAEPLHLEQMASAQLEHSEVVSSLPATGERLAGKGLKMLLKLIFGKWHIPIILGVRFLYYFFSRQRE